MVDEATTRAALAAGFSAFKVGEEPWFDLTTWHPPRGDKGKKYRWAVNHARGAGVEVDERAEPAEIEEVVRRWRASLRRPEPESRDAHRAARAVGAQAHLRRAAARRCRGVLACARLPAATAGTSKTSSASRRRRTARPSCSSRRRSPRLEGRSAASRSPRCAASTASSTREHGLGKALAVTIRGFDRRYGFRAMARYEGRFIPTEWRPRYVAFLPALPRPSVVRAAVRHLTA